ncbi:MerR family regulatory protein [Roseivivax jejudonensis]|uniref:MerR family regulatory protein n=1 Tax=Roseivivax jejudonensis TaxID=1529041 RepID=A0A1X6YRD3_9RHOB|nr:MerR family transcriptional regulator [Roseivivax jejudonensis]SLN29168.1 MerR family regulatory protein [Roseivivax jejudonensis]
MAKSPDAFRTISEVAEWLDTPAHVLRFWESKFTQVKPVKRAGGRRYYRPSDMELLGGIKKLLHDDGMTIKGVQKMLSEKGVKSVSALSQPVDMTAIEAEPALPEADEPLARIADTPHTDDTADRPTDESHDEEVASAGFIADAVPEEHSGHVVPFAPQKRATARDAEVPVSEDAAEETAAGPDAPETIADEADVPAPVDAGTTPDDADSIAASEDPATWWLGDDDVPAETPMDAPAEPTSLDPVGEPLDTAEPAEDAGPPTLAEEEPAETDIGDTPDVRDPDLTEDATAEGVEPEPGFPAEAVETGLTESPSELAQDPEMPEPLAEPDETVDEIDEAEDSDMEAPRTDEDVSQGELFPEAESPVPSFLSQTLADRLRDAGVGPEPQEDAASAEADPVVAESIGMSEPEPEEDAAGADTVEPLVEEPLTTLPETDDGDAADDDTAPAVDEEPLPTVPTTEEAEAAEPALAGASPGPPPEDDHAEPPPGPLFHVARIARLTPAQAAQIAPLAKRLRAHLEH